jgi:hypothetical protein
LGKISMWASTDCDHTFLPGNEKAEAAAAITEFLRKALRFITCPFLS